MYDISSLYIIMYIYTLTGCSVGIDMRLCRGAAREGCSLGVFSRPVCLGCNDKVDVSLLERCPHFRGCMYRLQWS